jgi:ABC-type uncharacterized transport system ATPase subunit
MSLLELNEVRKDFGGLAAVDDFSFRLEAGGVHALIGPNGCGKSTLFNLISGATPLSGGSIRFDGREIGGLQPAEISRLGIGRKFQVPEVFEELTVEQNLWVPAWSGARLSLWGEAAGADHDRILDRIRLTAKRAQRAGELSHGERQWLEIGMVLASRARLMLLDEPTAGMTQAETAATAGLIREIVADGVATVLVIEHDMGFIRRLDCPVTVMAKGKVLKSGSYAALQADPEVRALYFGRSGEFAAAPC